MRPLLRRTDARPLAALATASIVRAARAPVRMRQRQPNTFAPLPSSPSATIAGSAHAQGGSGLQGVVVTLEAIEGGMSASVHRAIRDQGASARSPKVGVPPLGQFGARDAEPFDSDGRPWPLRVSQRVSRRVSPHRDRAEPHRGQRAHDGEAARGDGAGYDVRGHRDDADRQVLRDGDARERDEPPEHRRLRGRQLVRRGHERGRRLSDRGRAGGQLDRARHALRLSRPLGERRDHGGGRQHPARARSNCRSTRTSRRRPCRAFRPRWSRTRLRGCRDRASDVDGSIVRYEWDFTNDGTFDYSSPTTASTTHDYGTAGTYTAKLRVTDNDGAIGLAVVTPERGRRRVRVAHRQRRQPGHVQPAGVDDRQRHQHRAVLRPRLHLHRHGHVQRRRRRSRPGRKCAAE